MTTFLTRISESEWGQRIRAILRKPYSGSVVAVAIGLVALVLLTSGFGFGFDWVRTWKVIGFPGALPPFSDLHVVTLNAGRCGAAPDGIYPYIPCAFATNAYNYPPIWLLLGKLGVTAEHTAHVAVFVELPGILLMIYLLRGYSIGLGLVALLLVLSPSVVLGFERGNIDLVEWTLVGVAAMLFSERSRLAWAASLLLLMVAIIVKFLALFCCAIIIRLRRMAVITAVALVCFTVIYFYSLSPVLPYIRSITPVTPFVSFGYSILFNRIEFLYAPRLGLDLTGLTQSWIPLACVVLVIVAALLWAIAIWRSGRSYCVISEERNGTAFIFGASIYLGCFLLLGTSFTYRLVFLLLCVPQLFDWIERSGQADKASARMSWLLLGCCVISLWLKFHPEKTLHINQITDWMLFGIFTMLFALNALYALQRVVPKSRLIETLRGLPTARASAADLKFLQQSPQRRSGTSNRKAALES
jgi:hypothetical protein